MANTFKDHHSRNTLAVSAHFRKAGSFHHKCQPRGGTRNNQRDFLALWEEEDVMENNTEETGDEH